MNKTSSCPLISTLNSNSTTECDTNTAAAAILINDQIEINENNLGFSMKTSIIFPNLSFISYYDYVIDLSKLYCDMEAAI